VETIYSQTVYRIGLLTAQRFDSPVAKASDSRVRDPVTALSSNNLAIASCSHPCSLLPSSITWYRRQLGRIYTGTPRDGVRLRAIETQIIAAL